MDWLKDKVYTNTLYTKVDEELSFEVNEVLLAVIKSQDRNLACISSNLPNHRNFLVVKNFKVFVSVAF